MQGEIEFCDEEAILLAKETLGDGLAHLTFQAPRIAQAACPGQFVMLYPLSGARSYDPLLGRPMAIAGANEGTVEICLSIAGRGTEIIHSLPIGARCRMRGPLGSGFPAPRGKILLVGGGIGVAPLLFACAFYGAMSSSLRFVMGVPHIGWKPFTNWVGERVRFLYVWSDDGSIGKKGSAVDGACTLYSGDEVWACGPVAMLKSLIRHIPTARVYASLERRMACGYGGCYGCVVPTVNGPKRVCRDGPVFEVKEVCWDEL